jgi:hypothetical protein
MWPSSYVESGLKLTMRSDLMFAKEKVDAEA